MTIAPGDECLYGARIERDKTGKDKIIGGMLCRVIAVEDNEAWCQSFGTKERFTVKAALLQPNRTEGS
jgi:hypothetical protein